MPPQVWPVLGVCTLLLQLISPNAKLAGNICGGGSSILLRLEVGLFYFRVYALLL